MSGTAAVRFFNDCRAEASRLMKEASDSPAPICAEEGDAIVLTCGENGAYSLSIQRLGEELRRYDNLYPYTADELFGKHLPIPFR